MAKPKLALIPASQGSKVFSVLPSDGSGDFDFSRSGSATRINSQGLIETVSNGQSRLNYPMIDGKVVGCPSLLLEPQRTNLITYSEDFTDSSWTKLGAGTASTAVVTSNYAISPDGTSNASRLQCDLNGGLTSSANQSLIYDTIVGNGDTTAFIYVKSNTSSSQNFYLANSLNDRITAVATTEWKKFKLNWNASGNGRTLTIGTRGSTGSDDTLDLLIWGAQVEEGSYATSYIPTNGTTVTRLAETANGAGNSDTFNDSEGVLMAEMSNIANDGTFKFISLSDGTLDNVVWIYYRSADNAINFRVLSSASTSFDEIYVAENSTNFNKLALKYKENDFSAWVNGFEVLTDSSGLTFSSETLNTIEFSRSDDTNHFYGNTKQIQYHNSALTDSELEQLTSWTSFTDMANGQLYTIE